MPAEDWRPLSPNEVALLSALTRLDFAGAGELHAQIPRAVARSGCGCGCGTLDLRVEAGSGPPAGLLAERPVQGEATVMREGMGIGGLLLFAESGYLSSLEIFGTTEEPLRLPDLSDLVTKVRPE